MIGNVVFFDFLEFVWGMKVLDRNFFCKIVLILGFVVFEKSIGKLVKFFKKEVLCFRFIKFVVELSVKDFFVKSYKFMLFNLLKIKFVEDFNED